MSYNSVSEWNKVYAAGTLSYPAEGVIRIFKGKFPNLNMAADFSGKRIVDLGCGDGRHAPLFQTLDMDISLVEISEDICAGLRTRFADFVDPKNVQPGSAAAIPFEDNHFDYMLTWNSCYYMSKDNLSFDQHVTEMHRVIKQGGFIVCSIPMPTSFIFKDSLPHSEDGYRVIQNDYFGSRDGEVMRCIADLTDLENSFGEKFHQFSHASIKMEWFGLDYHWYVFTAQSR